MEKQMVASSVLERKDCAQADQSRLGYDSLES